MELPNTPFAVTGRIKVIQETQAVSASFRKRDFVVEYVENPEAATYAQFIKFEVVQDRVIMLDQFRENDEVRVEFSLRGREWVNPKGERVYFTTLHALNVTRLGDAEAAPPPIMAPTNQLDDDLPF